VATARPAFTLALAVCLALAGVGYALTTLTLATSQRDLLPPGQASIQRYVEYSREFGELDDLAIAVEAPSLAEATEYANRLVRELRAREVPLKRIVYRIDPKQFEGRALLYLSPERLGEIRDRIYDNQALMEAFAASPTLPTLVDGISTQVASGLVSGFFDLGLSDSKGPIDLAFIDDLVRQLSERLDRPGPYRSPFSTLFSVSDHDESRAGYFLSEDQRLLFILAEPISRAGSFTEDREAIEGIRAVIASLRRDFPQVHVGVTGKPALANDEMTSAFRDSERATLVAFVLVLTVLLVTFLRATKPTLLLLVLAVSLGWSIGAATVGVGHLSLFSVMFIPIVIGIGIDYAVYFLFRYEEELFLGRSVREAIEITAMRTGPGVLLAAVTAAGSFYVLWLTDFRGLQELGFIAGTAILLAWVAMTVVLPAALVISDRRRPAPAIPPAMRLGSLDVPLVDRIARRPGAVLAMAVVVTALSLWSIVHVRFDYNLLNLQGAQHGIGGVGAPYSPVGPPLRFLRPRERRLPRRAAPEARRLRTAAERLRGRLGPSPHSERAAPQAQDHPRLRGARRTRPDRLARTGGGWPARHGALFAQATVGHGRRRGARRGRQGKARDDHGRARATHRQAPSHRARDERAHPDQLPATGLPRLPGKVPASAGQSCPTPGGAGRRASRDQEEVPERSRSLPPPGPSRDRYLGARRRRPLRERATSGRCRRDRHPGHHL
jgi:hypothetical protein